MIAHLMLIDDNDDDQMFYRRIIKKSGLVDAYHAFFMAEDALAFLRQPDGPMIDAILLDINMPGLSGFDFLDAAIQEFGEGFARIAVIMLTTSIHDEDKRRASRYPIIRDYINKPLMIDHLEKIDRMLAEGDKG